MKGFVITILLFMTCTIMSFAQEFSDIDKSVMDAAYYPARATFRAFAKTDAEKQALEPKIRILYSRPLKKDRVIFGELLKYGEPWRIGANESTELLLMTDAMIGGTTVPAGRYSLIAIPNENDWTVKVNSENDGWGNYSYDASKDVASVTVPTQNSEDNIEAMSITLFRGATADDAIMKIGWDHTFVEVPITLK